MSNRRRHRVWSLSVAIAVCVALAGCATHVRLLCRPIEVTYEGDYERAIRALDETSVARSERDAFLYRAQRGHLLHLAGDYEASNAEFERAVAVADALEPMSVSETVTDYTVNEAVKPYKGEDFERAYLHYYMALNYLAMDDLEEALVECRRLDEVFRDLDARYEEGTGRYQDDGFIRYLSGLIYEAKGDRDDAFIDYLYAIRAYEGDSGAATGVAVPDGLLRSAVCAARRRRSAEWPADLPDSSGVRCPDGPAEIVVIIENGWAPYKREESVRVPYVRDYVPEKYWEYPGFPDYVKIGYPVFESVPVAYRGFAVSAVPVAAGRGRSGAGALPDGGRPGWEIRSVGSEVESRGPSASPGVGAAASAPEVRVQAGTSPDEETAFTAAAERVQDVDALARWVLARRKPALILRSTIRATLKLVAVFKAQEAWAESKEAKKSGGDAGGVWSWLGDVLVQKVVPPATAETEQADTRSWVLLPSDIWIARIPVEPGDYEVVVRPKGGPPVSLGNVHVEFGGKVFRFRRLFGGPHPMRCEGS